MSRGEGALQRRVLRALKSNEWHAEDGPVMFLDNDGRPMVGAPAAFDASEPSMTMGDLLESIFGSRDAPYGDRSDLRRALDSLENRFGRIRRFPVVVGYATHGRQRKTTLVQRKRLISPGRDVD